MAEDTESPWGKSTPLCDGVRKVCIFDLDNTLTLGAEASNCPEEDRAVQPAWPFQEGRQLSGTTGIVKEAIRTCEEKGYQIAFATSETTEEAMNDRQKSFVKSLYPKANDAFFDSVFYQTAGKLLGPTSPEFPSKEAMLMNILGINGMGLQAREFGCSIFFDDDVQNLADGKRLGLKVVQASPECGGVHCPLGCGIPRSALSIIS